jgi:prolyl oligopeptidase
VVVDPNALDPSGKTAIQFYVPSLDGRRVAVCLAEGGSESGSLHVFDTSTGNPLADVIQRVNYATAGGSAAWDSSGNGIYYTRYPRDGERPAADMNVYQQIYFHNLGTSDQQDTYVVGKDFPRIAEISLESNDDGRYLLAIVANGDGGQYEHFLREPSGKWIQLTHFTDEISAATFGADSALYLVSRKNAPRGKILRLPLDTPSLAKATTVVPESDAVIQGMRFAISGYPAAFAATQDRLYVVDLVGGPNQIRIFDHSGHPFGTVPVEPVSSVGQVLRLRKGDVLYRNSSFLHPTAWYHYDPKTGKNAKIALSGTSPVRFDDAEVVRVFATSKDGTKVPLNIIRRKGTKLNGENPTLLTGYGGYGISMSPYFDPSQRIWLDAGGVYVIANLRGGGEFGQQWHRAGMLTQKQHVFDDFIASAQYLVKSGYTNPHKLAIIGGSNGGLLMGAVLTQQPQLFRSVVSIAWVYDMIHSETSQNGQFNVTEYGSVKNPAQFKALYAYSPYHHVVKGTKYPAILFTVGENDVRVDPWESRKMAARLQASTASNLPIFLISYSNAGHGGIGAAEDLAIAMEADAWTFTFEQLGMKFASAPLQKTMSASQ